MEAVVSCEALRYAQQLTMRLIPPDRDLTNIDFDGDKPIRGSISVRARNSTQIFWSRSSNSGPWWRREVGGIGKRSPDDSQLINADGEFAFVLD
jgi:hypothetical protein